MKRSQSLTALLFSAIVAALVVPMAGPPRPKGPPEIPKKPNAVQLAEVKPGPQDPPKPGAHGPNSREVLALAGIGSAPHHRAR